MMVQVPYSRFRGEHYPLLPVTLNGTLRTLALLDSGANYSLFTPEVAHGLGLDLKKGKKLQIGSIRGSLPVYMHNIRLEFANRTFTCKIGFTETKTAEINILGRDNFFRQYRITFDDKAHTLTLER